MQGIKLPTFSQWKKILKVLHKKEKVAFFAFLTLFIGSLIFLGTFVYIKNTKIVPASGGTLYEGLVGQPRFLNPIYGETSDVDRDLIELVFSGLMSYDKDGNLVNDLAESYKISEDGRNYEFTLKEGIFWHDAKPLTSEDVVFTIRTIQDSDYKSPLRANWIDVDTEIISNRSLRLKLKGPYNNFLENCTLKIIPKHVWENILPENFALSFYNLQPIGSGPYRFKELRQLDTGFITSLNLKANTKYYNNISHISEIGFKFFESKEDLLRAANKKNIDSYSAIYLSDNAPSKSFTVYPFSSPRYFAVFLNTASASIFSDAKVRQAINYATDKQELINTLETSLFKKYGQNTLQIVDSPILPSFFGYEDPTAVYEFNIEKAEGLLDSVGFKLNDEGKREKSISKKPAFQFTAALATRSTGTQVTELQKCLLKDPEIYQGDVTGYFGSATKAAVTKFQAKYTPELTTGIGSVGKTTRAKLNELCTPQAQESTPLKITLTTLDQPMLSQTAEILKNQWEKLGFTVDVRILSIQNLKPEIKNRSYDSLLYGEALGMLFDPYPFWHSSQKIDPGSNLSTYSNKDADQLLKDGRETLEPEVKKETYEKFQNILIKDAPAVFLYNSGYVYVINSKIQGIEINKLVDPSKRFAGIEDWYIKTKRSWK